MWKGQRYHLDRMSLRDLTLVYLLYPAVRIYALFLLLSVALAWRHTTQPLWSLAAVGAAVLLYPLVWYLLHRFVLHGSFLYRIPQTAALWKRIHFDHHQDPSDMRVLFGALPTTLPTIALATVPVGALIGGWGGAAAAFAAGIAMTLFYEFCHCVQHLRFVPRNAFLKRVKRLHMMHHFRNEQGNYGITNFFWDRLFGSYYDSASERPASPTVHNLGYTGEVSERYPWVAKLSPRQPQGS